MKRYIELNNKVMQKTDGWYQLENDKLAIDEFMLEVQSNYKQFDSHLGRIKWLIQNGYYIDLLSMYSEEFIHEALEYAYSFNFKFQSYMAVSKFYQTYALKSNDGKQYLETYEDRVVACALHLAQNNEDFAMELIKEMMTQRYQPATPTFLNSGKAKGGEFISCFLLEMQDSLNSINYNLNVASQLSKIGGGVAISLSNLRSRGEAIRDVEGCASGVVPVMKLMEDTFSYVNQLGQRAGAGVANLNVFHWDVEEFLGTKKINADEKSRLQTLSIGLVVPNKFMELAEKNENYYVFAPHTIYKEYGIEFNDINFDEMYDELVSNERIKKRQLNPRDLLIDVARTQFESGYPYIIYVDNANQNHTLHNIGKIKQSNLCTEIFQLQETSIINDYGIDDVIKRDINCNLGSLNIVNLMDSNDFEGAITTSMRALTSVSDLSNIANAEGVKKANRELHSVGLGAMNLHGYLAKNKIMYGSKESLDFVRTFFMMLNFYSIKASMHIAKDKGETFKDFDKTDYATGVYFDKYIEESYAPTIAKVDRLFEGIYIPTQADWIQLKDDVMTYGLYNAYRLAIAPTQSIGYVQNATPSIAPIVDVVEIRTYKNSTTYYPMPYLEKSNFFFYKSAYNMDMYKYIDLVAEAQKHIDQGISTILYVDSNTSTRELARLYVYAWKRGLKSIYYTRTRNLSVTECESCSV